MSHEGIRFTDREEQEREEVLNRPLPRIAISPEKVRVLLTEGKGVEIDWQDGHKSSWSFAWLREACPCAVCVEERKKEGRKPGEPKSKSAQLLPLYAPPPKPDNVVPVGRYAIRFDWADGHDTGIYSWEYLRRSCRCHECAFAETQSSGAPN